LDRSCTRLSSWLSFSLKLGNDRYSQTACATAVLCLILSMCHSCTVPHTVHVPQLYCASYCPCATAVLCLILSMCHSCTVPHTVHVPQLYCASYCPCATAVLCLILSMSQKCVSPLCMIMSDESLSHNVAVAVIAVWCEVTPSSLV